MEEQNGIGDYVKKLSTLNIKIDLLEDELSALKKDKAILEKVILPEELENLGLNSVKVEGVGSVFLKHSAHVSYLKEDESQLFDELFELGLEDNIKQTVHPSTLKSLVTERIKNGLPVPSVVKYTPFTQAQFRKG